MSFLEDASTVLKFIGKPLAGAKIAATAASIATLSVAATLVSLVSAHVALDLAAIKTEMKRKLKASVDSNVADARRRTANAAIASQKATLAKRDDAIARLEKQKLALDNAKTQAEIDAIRGKTENDRLLAIADAKSKLIEAVSKLQQAGGQFPIDRDGLLTLINAGPEPSKALPPPTSDPGGTAEQVSV